MKDSSFYQPLVAVVDFNHARGPEVEFWLGAEDGKDPAEENEWALLPFMALSDGAHASTEDFSYFTLRRNGQDKRPETSLFGISCTRQLEASKLKNKPSEVTRSTVQKAVVVVTDEPQHFGSLRERLSAVTSAWFDQLDFTDIEILKQFLDTLTTRPPPPADDKDQYIDPALDNYAQNLERPSSLKTSERSSLLAYMGLPIQIFGKGAFFGPYTPLQQLDLLADYGTKSYIVGSTNSLLLQQRDKYSDILINLDDPISVNITSTSLRAALNLSAADRRWIDFLTQTVNDTWDESNPDRPTNHGYMGSEEFIRLQFEEYLLALLSSISYADHLAAKPQPSPRQPHHHHHRSFSSDSSAPPESSDQPPADPLLDYSNAFVTHFRTTPAFALWSTQTKGLPLFDLIAPRHPSAGALTIEDIQRRLTQQVAELHLDEKMRDGREALNKHFSAGRERVGVMLGNVWAEMERLREEQRKRAAAGRDSSDQNNRTPSPALRPVEGELRDVNPPLSTPKSGNGWAVGSRKPNIDMAQVQANAAVAREKAGAYLSSWGAWAGEKRKAWEERRATSAASNTSEANKGVMGSPVGSVRSEDGAARSPKSGAAAGGVKKWTAGLGGRFGKMWDTADANADEDADREKKQEELERRTDILVTGSSGKNEEQQKDSGS
ncbi:MAG: hypothetical protein Q9227_006994 [Pyrenula ochraceoflavens]